MWQQGQAPNGTVDISHPGNKTSRPQQRVQVNLTAACGVNPCGSSAVRAGMAQLLHKRAALIAKYPHMLVGADDEPFSPDEYDLMEEYAPAALVHQRTQRSMMSPETHSAYAARLRSNTARAGAGNGMNR